MCPSKLLLACLVLAAAVSAQSEELPQQSPEHPPWQASGELGELLAKMDAACKRSQAVFEPLSAEQMNWRPPNGTHTPRWNVEHMRGTQLRFFSQIYAAIDPELHREIDLNPEQMPPDYEPAHPEWTGADEARFMGQVNQYVQSFAYLLEDLDLEAKAPGSRWKLRGLLVQMERHFDEHTANVRKKMELPEWPSE